jgi:hypothetical protein
MLNQDNASELNYNHAFPFDVIRYRAVIKNYVLNLIKSYQSGYFIRVSRNNNDYSYIERYSKIHTTHSIVIKSMGSLDDNGWIDLHIGFFDRHRKEGKQTRMFLQKIYT